ADLFVPVLDCYCLILSTGALVAARATARDPARNVAILRLESPMQPAFVPAAVEPPIGALVVLLGANFDGTPTARLGMVHASPRGGGSVALDVRTGSTEVGGAVLDTEGQFLGMAVPNMNDQITVVPARLLDALVDPSGAPLVGAGLAPVTASGTAAAAPIAARPVNGTRRGWLGVALQPITVPEPLVARAGQTSGRMVVNITHNGPADQAGLRVGDVLLALNGYTTSGPHALRAFLGADRIGTQIEVRLLRDGTVLTTFLTVAAQPA
ncbi:MAG: S1C family serine protease, partial [Acetobacteraceae bacterium]